MVETPARLAPAAPRAASRRSPRTTPAVWVAAVSLPFLVLAARIALHRGHVYTSGDFALLDLAAHRAAHWQQLLGPYDRFGWRHPGPVYLYLISFVARLVGAGHGTQSQAVTAALVNGLALAGLVLMVTRLAGRRAGAIAAAAGCATVVGIGATVMFNPWNPYVVVLPLALACVLAVAAGRGSLASLAALLVVATFVVQSDLATLPLVVLLVGGAGILLTRRRRAGSDAAGTGGSEPASPAAVGVTPTPRTVVGVLLAVTAMAWLPAIYQEVSGSPRNLSAIVSFFRHGHVHAGVVAGARASGLAQAAVIGVRPRMLPSTGAAGIGYLAASVLLSGAVVAIARRRGDRLAAELGVVWLAGTVVAVGAGAEIVGPTYAYLMSWAAAPALVGGVGAAVLLFGGTRPTVPFGARRLALPSVRLLALVAAGCLLARTILIPDIGHDSDRSVAAAWRVVAPRALAHPGQVVGLWFVTPEGWAVGAGVADELDGRGVGYAVLPRWSFQFDPPRRGRPAWWAAIAEAGVPTPQGYRVLAHIRGLSVAEGDTPPPGWPGPAQRQGL